MSWWARALSGVSFGNPEDEYGLANYTIQTIPSLGAGVSSSTDAIVAVDTTFSAGTQGILFELGADGGQGFAAGFDGASSLRARAYSSTENGATPFNNDTDAAFIETDMSEYVGQFCTLYFVVDQSARSLSLFIKVGGSQSTFPVVLLQTATPDVGNETGVYGSGDKGYGTVNSASADLNSVDTTNHEIDYTGSITEIRIWTEDAGLDASFFGLGYGL